MNTFFNSVIIGTDKEMTYSFSIIFFIFRSVIYLLMVFIYYCGV